MAARVVHADVLARHATAGEALSLVFHLLGRKGGAAEVGSEEGIAFGQLAVAEVVEQFLVIGPQPFHQFAVDAAVMFDAIAREVDLFAAGGELQVPALLLPAVAALGESLGYFVHLGLCELRLFDALLGEVGGFLHEVSLHLAVA